MHAIRLRRPWTRICDDQTDIKINVPDNQPIPASGSVSYQRKFNCPTNLNDTARVFLKVNDWRGKMASVEVNGQAVELGASPLRIDITEHLQPNNLVRIQLAKDDKINPLLCGEVQLEIEGDAHQCE